MAETKRRPLPEQHQRANPNGARTYYVSEAKLAAFAKLTPIQRLQWLEKVRLAVCLARQEKAPVED